VCTPEGHRDLCLMGADGTGRRRLTTEPSDEFHPAWSPDGTRLAYQAVRGENYDVEVLDLRSGTRTRLTSGDGYDGQADWAPDGTALAIISDRDGTDGLYLVDAATGAATRLAAHPALDPDWTR